MRHQLYATLGRENLNKDSAKMCTLKREMSKFLHQNFKEVFSAATCSACGAGKRASYHRRSNGDSLGCDFCASRLRLLPSSPPGEGWHKSAYQPTVLSRSLFGASTKTQSQLYLHVLQKRTIFITHDKHVLGAL